MNADDDDDNGDKHNKKEKHKRGYDGICCPVIKSCYDVFSVK